ncbi:MAG: calcium/sodium antiporter [Candidatus Doudnabacteria bacterium]|nr:calcium/sodium antiporter [bacterium]MDZ4244107.1 calcium/sodium antiporter [Candidatus Doudnabacteria bacterium]
MITTLLLLILGFAILIKGAGILVDGAVVTAEKLRISPLIIGLTIVAFGTSSPELAVNVISALHPGTSDLGLGNIIGSNIANIGLIVGISALLTPLVIKKVLISREIPFMTLSAVAFLILIADQALTGQTTSELSRADGLTLLLFFAIFLYYLTKTVFAQREVVLEEEFAREYKQSGKTWTRAILFILGGLVGVVVGGQMVVGQAAALARSLGVSEILIGLTIVGVGTSLPELATSIAAAFKKEADIAVGNIVGSNIFNTFFILGINAVISPVPFKTEWFADAWVMIAFSLMLFFVSLTGKIIRRSEGFLLTAGYLAYLIFIITRN